MSALNAEPRAVADSESGDEPLFAIAGDNDWVHVYPTVRAMLSCEDTFAANPGPLDFFDVHGRRLTPIFIDAWALQGLRLATDPPNPDMVHKRLCAVLESVRTSLAHRLAQNPHPPGTPEAALGRLPQLEGRDLSECFTLLSPHFGDGGGHRRDDGSFWHNFWCHS